MTIIWHWGENRSFLSLYLNLSIDSMNRRSFCKKQRFFFLCGSQTRLRDGVQLQSSVLGEEYAPQENVKAEWWLQIKERTHWKCYCREQIKWNTWVVMQSDWRIQTVADSDRQLLKLGTHTHEFGDNVCACVWSLQYLGIKLLQERLLGCRHHCVQVGLEGLELLSQKHTVKQKTKPRHCWLIQCWHNVIWKMYIT